MAQYKYEAVSADGKTQKGVIEASAAIDAVSRLKSNGLYCVSCAEAEVKKENLGKMRDKELISFATQFGALLNAGITVSGALEVLYQSADGKRVKAVILALIEGTNTGRELSEVIDSLGKVFPPIVKYMVETGETEGNLAQAFEKLASHFESSSELKSKTQTALVYPIMLTGVSIISISFMLVYVIPQFVSMYAEDILPWSTKLLISMSAFLKKNGVYLLAAIAAVAVTAFLWLRKRSNMVKFKKLQLDIPFAGKLVRTVLTARFADIFSVLFSSGIPIVKSLDIASKVTNNVFLEDMVSNAIIRLNTGESLHKSLEETKAFDKLFISMVRVGEESSSLDKVMGETSTFFNKQAVAAMMKFIAVLEPCMILVLGGIIGFVVISMIMPIFNSYGAML